MGSYQPLSAPCTLLPRHDLVAYRGLRSICQGCKGYFTMQNGALCKCSLVLPIKSLAAHLKCLWAALP